MRYSMSPSRNTFLRASLPSYLIFRNRSITKTFSSRLCCCMNVHASRTNLCRPFLPMSFMAMAFRPSSSCANCADFRRMKSLYGSQRFIRCMVLGHPSYAQSLPCDRHLPHNRFFFATNILSTPARKNRAQMKYRSPMSLYRYQNKVWAGAQTLTIDNILLQYAPYDSRR